MDCRPSRTKKPDEWVATCPEFSRSICEELRELIFRWAADLNESVNSNMLCYSGRKRVLALGAFRDHAEICFYRGAELQDPAGLFNHGLENVSIRGIKLKSMDEMDLNALRRLVQEAVALDASLAPPPVVKSNREPWPMPPELLEGLKQNPEAKKFFESLKPTYQREYMVWVGTAKREETKQKRLEETLRALAAGFKWVDRKKA